jgi:hypothetical protein
MCRNRTLKQILAANGALCFLCGACFWLSLFESIPRFRARHCLPLPESALGSGMRLRWSKKGGEEVEDGGSGKMEIEASILWRWGCALTVFVRSSAN